MAIDNPGKAWLQKAHYNLSFKRYLVYINIWKNANRSKENHTKREKKNLYILHLLSMPLTSMVV